MLQVRSLGGNWELPRPQVCENQVSESQLVLPYQTSQHGFMSHKSSWSIRWAFKIDTPDSNLDDTEDAILLIHLCNPLVIFEGHYFIFSCRVYLLISLLGYNI